MKPEPTVGQALRRDRQNKPKGMTMRHYISKLNLKQITLRYLMFVGVILAVAIPVKVFAYGPERPTFTMASPANYVTFDSITDNNHYGDERNFFRIRDVAAGTPFIDEANLVAGKEYEVKIFYHNNAKTSLNAGGTGIAHDAYARAEMPAVVKAGGAAVKANAYVGASNANPTTVYDYIDLKNSTGTDMSIRHVDGSAHIYSNGPVNGKVIDENALFGSSGAKLGYDALNGTLPGCDTYSGYILFRFKAVQPSFTFKKDVRLSATKEWKDSVTAAPGAKVDYLLSYKNTGTTEQRDVVLKDVLPKGLTYVQGSSKLTNTLNPNGLKAGDGIGGGGIDIGHYGPGATAFLVFSATVSEATCDTLTNTASVETTNGNLQDTAQVLIPGTACTLPTTGPVEVVAGFVGVGAITLGVVYYFKSRRDLEDALLEVHQSATTVTHHDHKKDD
jgi:uncharacterized repeat protein (TIGR01451 family)